MNYKKILKVVLGCFLILCSSIVFSQTITWQFTQKDYNKQYVYSDAGILSYEIDDEKIYIEKMYNTNGETLELDIPDKKTIIMYCYKDKPTEGIYLGINNTADSRLQAPIVNIYVSAFILVIAILILSNKKIKDPIRDLYLIYVLLFLIGIGMSCWQINNIIDYCILKDDDNIVNATIYSEIYEMGTSTEKCKSVSYYYVDNNKYTHVSEIYKDGNIDELLGTTEKLYYNPDNPTQVSSEIEPLNFFLLIVGIFITALTFPIVFFRNKMSKRYKRAVGGK